MADEERGRYAGRGGDAPRLIDPGETLCELLAEVADKWVDEALAIAHIAVAAEACKGLGPLETASLRVSASDIDGMLRTHTLERKWQPDFKGWTLTLTPRLDPAPAAAA